MKLSIEKKQLREFGILIGFGFPILIGWIVPYFSGHDFGGWTLLIGVPSLTLGILKPSLLFYPYLVWMKLSLALGWLNSCLFLGLIFLIILQPIALIMKIFGYDPLRLKKRIEKSYREKKHFHKINLTRIF